VNDNALFPIVRNNIKIDNNLYPILDSYVVEERLTGAGFEWEEIYTGDKTFSRLVYGNGIFVSACIDGFMTSSNGKDWEGIFPFPSGTVMRSGSGFGICYDSDRKRFLAVLQTDNLQSNQMVSIISQNGRDWSISGYLPAGYVMFNRMAYGNGIYVIFTVQTYPFDTRFTTSYDGINWTIRFIDGITMQFGGLVFAKGLFIATVSNTHALSPYRILFSQNGIDWSLSIVNTNPWHGVDYGNDIFMAVSLPLTNAPFPDSHQKIAVSSDGMNWELLTVDAPNTEGHRFTDICFGDGIFIISTRSAFFITKDGSNFIGPIYPNNTNTWVDMKYGSVMNVFIVIASLVGGIHGKPDHRVMRSTGANVQKMLFKVIDSFIVEDTQNANAILRVSISPNPFPMTGNVQFVANVEAIGNISPAVIWSLTGNNHANTMISTSGYLTVHNQDNNNPALVVRAASIADPAKFGETRRV
jgi:hypothetical protein